MVRYIASLIVTGPVPFLHHLMRSRRAMARSVASLVTGVCSSIARTVSCTLWAAARPNTTISTSEFEPSRLAPCTETQAASQIAINSVTTSLDVV